MTMTLDDVFVPACLQMLRSISGVLVKAQAHAKKHNIKEADILSTRLTEDMWPVPNQIQSMWAHSAYAIRQVKSGEFHPTTRGVPQSFEDIQTLLLETITELETLQIKELETIANDTVHFILGGKPMFTFTTQNFLLSFSMPNVHFHATTAYDILRMQGVEIGKFDFLGKIRKEVM